MHEILIRDERINAYRVIRGENATDVDAKATAQLAAWEDKWQRRQAVELARAAKEVAQRVRFLGASQAAELTAENKAAIRAVESILVDGMKEPILDWNALKDQTEFKTPKPVKSPLLNSPSAPAREQFQLQLRFLDKLLPSRKAAKSADAEARFQQALSQWEGQRLSIEDANAKTIAEYERQLEDWKQQRNKFQASRKAQHDFIEMLSNTYLTGDAQALEFIASELLSRSSFPENFPQGFDLKFDPLGKLLIVDYELPNLEALPKYREIKYIASKSQLQYLSTTDTWRKNAYDSLLYQMTLLTIHRLFSVDRIALVHSVVFNGWVRSIDPATGAEAHGCILSLQAGRDEFTCLDLARVDPKACFRALKGVGSAKLIELTLSDLLRG